MINSLYDVYFGKNDSEDSFAHVGRSKRDGAKVGSGRYPLGSGKEPYQHNNKLGFGKQSTKKTVFKNGKTDENLSKYYDDDEIQYIKKISEKIPIYFVESYKDKRNKNDEYSNTSIFGVCNDEKRTKVLKDISDIFSKDNYTKASSNEKDVTVEYINNKTKNRIGVYLLSEQKYNDNKEYFTNLKSEYKELDW